MKKMVKMRKMTDVIKMTPMAIRIRAVMNMTIMMKSSRAMRVTSM